MEPIIRVENLTHTYSAGTPFERSAVKGLHMDVMRGEFLGIIGHTGSGKSTLISHLNGLLKPTSGRVLLAGKDIWENPKEIRKVRFQVGLVCGVAGWRPDRWTCFQSAPESCCPNAFSLP